MSYNTQQDILDFVEDNNVKFVRFAFCDIFGTQKNIAVLASDLPKALEDGDVLLEAEDVTEREADKFYVVVLDEIEDVLLCRITHRCVSSEKYVFLHQPEDLPLYRGRPLGVF